MRQISANQDYQTSASPSRSMMQVREKKKNTKKVRKKGYGIVLFLGPKIRPKNGTNLFLPIEKLIGGKNPSHF